MTGGAREAIAAGEPTPSGTAAPTPLTLSTSGALVPDWLVNIAALGWRVLAIAVLLVVVWFVATTLWTVTASIAVAIVIAAVFAPYVLRLRASGRSRTAAAAIVWALAILVVGGVLLLMGLAFLPYLVDLLQQLDAGMSELQARLAELNIPPAVETLAQGALDAVKTVAGDTGGGIVSAAASAVTIAILATFLVFFFLRDGDRAWVWMFQAASDQKRERITAAGDDALARVGGYLRGTTVLSAIIALTDLAFMLLLGVPLAVPLAMLAFFAGYVPYFGGLVTTGLILLVTLGTLGPTQAVVMLVLMVIRGAILGYFVRPAVYGRTVSIHPALVLIVLPAGFELGGLIGLFAAVPVTAVILAVASATVAIMEPETRPRLPALVPAWLDRAAQWSWRLVVVVALIALCVVVLDSVPLVFMPLVVAVILAATLEPLVAALVRRGRTRAAASAIAVGGSFLLVLALLVLAMVVLVDQAPQVADTATAGADQANAALGGQLGLGSQAVHDGAGAALKAIVGVADSIAAFVTVTLLGTLLAFYFLRDGGRLWGRLMAHVPSDAVPSVDAAGSRAFDVLGGYMVGTAAISFVGAASQWLIMVLLGLPLALPVFVLSFFLCFIPYIGSFLSTLVAFLIAVAVGSTTDVVVMGIWTAVFNIVQGNVVSPMVYGRTVHVHPAIVLVAIPAGAAVAGVLGMFVVVPAIGVVAATWRTVLAVVGSRRSGVDLGLSLPLLDGTLGPPPAP